MGAGSMRDDNDSRLRGPELHHGGTAGLEAGLGAMGMTTRAAAAQLRREGSGSFTTDVLSASQPRGRPSSASAKRPSSAAAVFVGDAEAALKGTSSSLAGLAAGKKRAALGDISNTAGAANRGGWEGKGKEPAGAHVLGTRELDAIMSRPLVRPTPTGGLAGSLAKALLSEGREGAPVRAWPWGQRRDLGTERSVGGSGASAQSNTEARLQLEQRRVSHGGAPRAQSARGLLPHEEGLVLQHAAPGAHAAAPAGSSTARGLWKDIDAGHQSDPLMCTMYIEDIYTYLRREELRHRPREVYMDEQLGINQTMRGILVDWLVEVAEEYKLAADTLFLAVNLIDRYLSKEPCERCMLQLVGVTCMLIAAKFEEIYAPQVDDFCYITDNTYTHAQVVEMERKVLDKLGFNLATPTAKTFVRRYLHAAECQPGDKVDCLASFLAELTLLGYNFMRFPPSMVAAACTFLALHVLNRTAWTVTLQHYTRYRSADLRVCVEQVHEAMRSAPQSALPAIREKYNTPKLKSVSGLEVQDTLPDYLFQTAF